MKYKMLTSINFTAVAKFMLCKLVPLSVSGLIAATAYANCPPADTILTNYVKNGVFVEYANGQDKYIEGKDWVLNSESPPTAYTKLQLTEIRLIKPDDGKYIKYGICTYNNENSSKSNNNSPSQAKPLYLSVYSYDKITRSGYTLNGGSVNKPEQWRDQGNTYFCDDLTHGVPDECGGFEFTLGRVQPNRYWINVYENSGEHGRGEIDQLIAGSTPRCPDAVCSGTIDKMNLIVDMIAKIKKLCWAVPPAVLPWQNKKWPDDGKACIAPSEVPWPDRNGTQGADVYMHSAPWYSTYLYIKTPGAAQFEYCKDSTEGNECYGINRSLSKKTEVCVAALYGANFYHNFYFEVTKQEVTSLRFYGPVRNGYYGFNGDKQDQKFNNAGLIQIHTSNNYGPCPIRQN